MCSSKFCDVAFEVLLLLKLNKAAQCVVTKLKTDCFHEQTCDDLMEYDDLL